MNMLTTIPSQKKWMWLAAAGLLQLLVLAGEYLNSVYPLISGTQVFLEVEPVDPRDLFRGNYARLNYKKMAQLTPEMFPGKRLEEIQKTRFNTPVYVILQKKSPSLWIAESATFEIPRNLPPDKIFIRGRWKEYWRFEEKFFEMEYGIEAFFAPREKAEKLENDIRQIRQTSSPEENTDSESVPALAEIWIAPNGKAALKNVTIQLKIP